MPEISVRRLPSVGAAPGDPLDAVLGQSVSLGQQPHRQIAEVINRRFFSTSEESIRLRVNGVWVTGPDCGNPAGGAPPLPGDADALLLLVSEKIRQAFSGYDHSFGINQLQAEDIAHFLGNEGFLDGSAGPWATTGNPTVRQAIDITITKTDVCFHQTTVYEAGLGQTTIVDTTFKCTPGCSRVGSGDAWHTTITVPRVEVTLYDAGKTEDALRQHAKALLNVPTAPRAILEWFTQWFERIAGLFSGPRVVFEVSSLAERRSAQRPPEITVQLGLQRGKQPAVRVSASLGLGWRNAGVTKYTQYAGELFRDNKALGEDELRDLYATYGARLGKVRLNNFVHAGQSNIGDLRMFHGELDFTFFPGWCNRFTTQYLDTLVNAVPPADIVSEQGVTQGELEKLATILGDGLLRQTMANAQAKDLHKTRGTPLFPPLLPTTSGHAVFFTVDGEDLFARTFEAQEQDELVKEGEVLARAATWGRWQVLEDKKKRTDEEQNEYDTLTTKLEVGRHEDGFMLDDPLKELKAALGRVVIRRLELAMGDKDDLRQQVLTTLAYSDEAALHVLKGQGAPVPTGTPAERHVDIAINKSREGKRWACIQIEAWHHPPRTNESVTLGGAVLPANKIGFMRVTPRLTFEAVPGSGRRVGEVVDAEGRVLLYWQRPEKGSTAPLDTRDVRRLG